MVLISQASKFPLREKNVNNLQCTAKTPYLTSRQETDVQIRLCLSLLLFLKNNTNANVIDTLGASSAYSSLDISPHQSFPWVQFSQYEASRSSAELSV